VNYKEKDRETLKTIISVSSAILITFVVGILFLTVRKFDSNYGYHKQHVQSAESWSPGTLVDAKRVVAEIMTFPTNKPGDIKVQGNHLRAWYIQRLYGFDNYDIVYKNTYMLLTKPDYKAYVKWLREISKPYVTYKKMLTPPLMPPPWDGSER